MLFSPKLTGKLENLRKTHQELTEKLSDPGVLSNPSELARLSKTVSDMAEVLEKHEKLKKLLEEELGLKRLLSEEGTNEEFQTLAEGELAELEQKIKKLQQGIFMYFVPPDPNDGKNIIVEIRAGTGGEEASLFAGELFRMYTRYAELRGWKTEILSQSATGLGGVKEATFAVKGVDVYRRLKFECGTHRVQRVPLTESSGRIHTSAATVAVLPEAEEVDISIRTDDLKIDVFRASGAGGQHVNKTSSAVRITYLPTGLVVSCQDERSQHQNKEKALRLLRAYLFEERQKEQSEKLAKERKAQVGSGDRSEKIRTYNFPQDRVTDHRIGLTVHNLQGVLDGKLEPIIEVLLESETEEKLKTLAEQPGLDSKI